MITIDLLKNNPHTIPEIANIWQNGLGKVWMPEIGIEEIKFLYHEELKGDLPCTYIALSGEIPIASCTLQLKEGNWPDLGPWISDLVVDPRYQKQGIGRMLIDAVILKAKSLGFKVIYLFVFNDTMLGYYKKIGWKKIGDGDFESHQVTLMNIDL